MIREPYSFSFPFSASAAFSLVVFLRTISLVLTDAKESKKDNN